MHHLEFLLVTATRLLCLYSIIFPIMQVTSGADECRTQTLQCYDCDSRHDPYCSDPFNKTLPPEYKPATRVCEGCCVKFVHKFPNEEWVQRSCTENIIINYFMVDHVCMWEGKGHGKMCFCETDYCNDGLSSMEISRSTNILQLILVSVTALLSLKLPSI